MPSLQDMADKLADDVLAAEAELGDDRFYEKVSAILLAASPTFNEAFMTAVRVRLAERRGREVLVRALATRRGESAETPAAAPGTAPKRSSGH